MVECGNLFPVAACWLFAVTGLQSLAVFIGLVWALHRSDLAFYSIFVGDALLRFLVLGLSLVLLNHWHAPVTVPLLSLGAGYLILSIIQIPFLHRMPLV